ncbi:MAG: hypothetical protein HDR24_02785 [Lachnospiraceae bacterium]|nr:hypothetical protein [Lachnospiraceae bacterium]
MKEDKLNEDIVVTTEDALKNAIKAGYGTIYIRGDCANEIAGNIRHNNTGNALANAGMVLGLLCTPLFVASVAGKLLTKDMSKYKIIEVSNDNVLIKHKSIIE